MTHPSSGHEAPQPGEAGFLNRPGPAQPARQAGPWLVTSFAAGPATAKEMGKALFPLRFVLILALLVPVLLARLVFVRDSSGRTFFFLLVAALLSGWLVWRTTQSQRKALARLYFPGAQWSAQFFDDHFVLSTPATGAIVPYKEVEGVVVKPHYLTIKLSVGTPLVVRGELFPDQARGVIFRQR